MAEVGAIVEQEGASEPVSVTANDRSAVSIGQTSSALSPNAVENAAISNCNQPDQRAFDFDYRILQTVRRGLLRDMSRPIGVAELQFDGRIVPVDNGGLRGQNLRANRRYCGHLDGLQHGRTVDSHVGCGAC